ncbi:MAG: TetR family transcriptional regulator [Candidatus Thiodiazotropha sp.]
MRRTKEDAEITRQNIIETGLRLFSRQGVSATSLVEIAGRAGVSRGAVYWHFKNKWELFEAILSRYSARIDELGGAGQLESESDPLGRLEDLLRFLFVNVAKQEDFRNIFKIILHERFMRREADVPQRIHDLIDKSLQEKVRTLDNAKRKGQLPADLDSQAGAQVIHLMFEGFVQNWLKNPDDHDLAARSGGYVEAIFSVLRNSLKESRH